MAAPKGTPQTVNVTDARRRFAELLNAVVDRGARVVLSKNRIPVAALISPRDLEKLRRLEADREHDFTVLDEIGASFKDVPLPILEREVSRAVTAVRAERPGTRRRRTT